MYIGMNIKASRWTHLLILPSEPNSVMSIFIVFKILNIDHQMLNLTPKIHSSKLKVSITELSRYS